MPLFDSHFTLVVEYKREISRDFLFKVSKEISHSKIEIPIFKMTRSGVLLEIWHPGRFYSFRHSLCALSATFPALAWKENLFKKGTEKKRGTGDMKYFTSCNMCASNRNAYLSPRVLFTHEERGVSITFSRVRCLHLKNTPSKTNEQQFEQNVAP